LAGLAISRRMGVPIQQDARFECLYRSYSDAVLAYALRRATPESAAEVAAETFLIAWRRLPEVPAGAELPWLYSVARRVLSTQRRSNMRQQAVAARLAFEPGVQSVDPSVDRSTPVLEAIGHLGADDQEVLILTAWEELNSREAAVVLGCSPTAYRLRLHRARKRLHAVIIRMERGRPRPAQRRLPARPEREGGST
jgi:RNA polymerase sigma-70 factor, ECF subfamily